MEFLVGPWAQEELWEVEAVQAGERCNDKDHIHHHPRTSNPCEAAEGEGLWVIPARLYRHSWGAAQEAAAGPHEGQTEAVEAGGEFPEGFGEIGENDHPL